jgi:hypothetical protein
VVKKVAADVCNFRVHGNFTAMLQVLMSSWPRYTHNQTISDHYDSSALFVRQELLIQMLKEKGCEPHRRLICSVSLDAMGKQSLLNTAAPCREEKDLRTPDREVGIKPKLF